MLSSNFPHAARARVHAAGSVSAGSTNFTVESFTYTRETSVANAPPMSPKSLHDDFERYSQATTVVYTPNAVTAKPPPPEVVDVEANVLRETLTGNDADISDMSSHGSPDSDILLIDLIQKKRPSKSVQKTPTTPTDASPPKKKADTCPSDEKKFMQREVEIVAIEVKDSNDECSNKENAAFASVAPCSVHSNSENSNHSSKRVMFRGDVKTAPDAVRAFIDRNNPTLQTVISADSNNNITHRAPRPPPPPPIKKETTEIVVTKNNKTKKSEWALKDAAYKNEHTFRAAMRIKKGEIFSNRIKLANAKIARAFEKEAEDVFGELLMDIAIGVYNPAKAKVSVESNY